MEAVNTENEKVKKKFPIKKILFFIFVILPILVVSFLYFNNKNFKLRVNKALSKTPGAVGTYFKNAPTESEKNDKLIYLANYFLELEPSTAADKMYIIKKDDEKLYVDLIRNMNGISVPKTEEIVLKVRDLELRKDLLFSVYQDAQVEEEEKFRKEVSRIENQDMLATISEVERNYSNKDFIEVLKEVKPDRLANILYYVDGDVRNYIIEQIPSKNRVLVLNSLDKKTNDEKALRDMAKIYENKSTEVAIEAIGNTETYSIDKLASIYRNLSVLKSAEILLNINDEAFLESLFKAIIIDEQLNKENRDLANEINKSMDFLTEYKRKIKNLVKSYEDMTAKSVADITEKMMRNTETITLLDLNIDESYELSDSVIIVDILSELKNDKLSKVIESMKPEDGAYLTQLLAKPKSNLHREGGE